MCLNKKVAYAMFLWNTENPTKNKLQTKSIKPLPI